MRKTSFEGMEGMEGMVGLVSGGSGGLGSGFFADRIDLPFVTVGDFTPIDEKACWTPSFPVNNWTPEWYSWLVLTEFVRDDAWTGWGDSLLQPWMKHAGHVDWTSDTAKPKIAKEIAALVTAARDERADALGEILGQSTEFVSYFLNLAAVPNTHPQTGRMLRIDNFIGGYCAMYYKGLFQRPRPSMVWPPLLPPTAVPGHASFPSGHSTQAHLIQLCLKDVLANRPDLATLVDDALILADRIARNRELAGLHYRSDSVAGATLAGKAYGMLQTLAAKKPEPPNWYSIALSKAQAEWALK